MNIFLSFTFILISPLSVGSIWNRSKWQQKVKTVCTVTETNRDHIVFGYLVMSTNNKYGFLEHNTLNVLLGTLSFVLLGLDVWRFFIEMKMLLILIRQVEYTQRSVYVSFIFSLHVYCIITTYKIYLKTYKLKNCNYLIFYSIFSQYITIYLFIFWIKCT